ncbi:uncharacterized protein V6R79_007321 [Siganus canaliculatus]
MAASSEARYESVEEESAVFSWKSVLRDSLPLWGTMKLKVKRSGAKRSQHQRFHSVYDLSAPLFTAVNGLMLTSWTGSSVVTGGMSCTHRFDGGKAGKGDYKVTLG